MLAAQMKYRDAFVLNQDDLTVSGSWSTLVDRNRPDADTSRNDCSAK